MILKIFCSLILAIAATVTVVHASATICNSMVLLVIDVCGHIDMPPLAYYQIGKITLQFQKKSKTIKKS